MLNVKFDTGVSSVSVDVSEIKIVIESMLSLYYKFSVSVSGIDSELIPTIENADVVKIYVSNQLVAEGKYISSEIHSIDDKITVNALFENTTMNFIKRSFIDNQIVNGDIVDELSRSISLFGIKTVVSMDNVEPRREVLNGCVYNLLRNATREKNICWNISNNKVYIGDILSERVHTLDKSTAIVFYNSFVNKNQELVKFHNASVRYDAKLLPGDSITIDNNKYIIGKAKHYFVYRSQGNVLFKTTNLSLFNNNQDLFDNVEIADTLGEPEDYVDSSVLKFLYDPVDNRPAFNDINRKKWVCENEKVASAKSQAGPAQVYFNIQGCAMSATFGYNIPYDSVITDYRLMLASTDVAFIEIMRNGEVIYSIPCNATSKYEKLDLLFAPGVLSFRYTPGAGAAGIAKVFIEVNYREFIRNS